jgi:hypothetical protein
MGSSIAVAVGPALACVLVPILIPQQIPSRHNG